MPEGPEARIVADQLNKRLIGLSLSGNSDLGCLEKVITVGKQLYFIFEDVTRVLNYGLGMQGHFFLREEYERRMPKHIKSVLKFGKKEGLFFIIEEIVYFDDADGKARFQQLSLDEMSRKMREYPHDWMEWVLPQEIPENIIDHIPTEVFEPPKIREIWSFTKPKRVDKMICDVMLDQKLSSGIGNYIKSEALYRAKIKPGRKISTITDSEFYLLEKELKKIFYNSYLSGGLTHGSFIAPDGSLGKFERLVYRLEYCPKGHKIIRSLSKGDRSNYFCEVCQK